MSGKYRSQISKDNKKEESKNTSSLQPVASEGLVVVLNAHYLITELDVANSDSIKNYSQKPFIDVRNFHGNAKNYPTISFTVLYVKDGQPHTTLSFELTITHKKSNTRNSPYEANVIVKQIHRSIIFQGGVALGAYESGAYKDIVKKLVKNIEDKENR